MSTFWTIILIVIIFPLVFFVQLMLNACPGRKNHDWEYVGTEIHKGYKRSMEYKKYVCKNCGKVEYE